MVLDSENLYLVLFAKYIKWLLWTRHCSWKEINVNDAIKNYRFMMENNTICIFLAKAETLLFQFLFEDFQAILLESKVHLNCNSILTLKISYILCTLILKISLLHIHPHSPAPLLNFQLVKNVDHSDNLH